ncbi:hypothetical protein CGGC5_v009641 [Colletotrichum fructicola Nara gc5]|uniref:Uncharacterized protein n=1 Tax=Colletotrichum fructicola (strain Nara gc5) TaxID=1213859 RepID=A0A7J6J0G5_COLFN|nr:hypothetical protein CGGC5_v009641 [Colletotrichum fructicola Nara gc5]
MVKNAFHKCILSLADAQLITGISILVSAYWSLKHGPGLSAYHWETAVYLAWFSSVTHLSALTFLRTYLAKHPKGRLCRLIFMFILLVLLFVGIIPTGHFEFLDGDSHFIDLGQNMYPKDCDDFKTNGSQYYPKLHQTDRFPGSFRMNDSVLGPQNCTISGTPIFQLDISANYLLKRQMIRTTWIIRGYVWNPDAEIAVLPESPAACFFRGNMNSSSDAYVSMISSLVILVYGYLIRASKVFEGPSKLISHRIQRYLDNVFQLLIQKWEKLLNRTNSRTVVFAAMVLLPVQTSVFCTFRMVVHLYTSMCAELTVTPTSLAHY